MIRFVVLFAAVALLASPVAAQESLSGKYTGR
jgi:hypothetical protein